MTPTNRFRKTAPDRLHFAALAALLLVASPAAAGASLYAPDADGADLLATAQVGAAVILSGSKWVLATPHVAVAAAPPYSEGVPVQMACYDNDGADGWFCGLIVAEAGSLFGTCGPEIGRARSTETGFSLVTFVIPPAYYEGTGAALFCANPTVKGIDVGNPSYLTVVGG